MNLLKTMFFFLSLMVLTSHVFAAVPDGTVITQETLLPLANWVEQATDVRIKNLPVTVASDVRLKIALNYSGVQKANAAATYMPGQIIISSAIWEPTSLRMQSYLVHELVHHAQFLSRRKYPCGAAKEREAYTLQNRWLIEHGEEALVSKEWIDKISACPGDAVTE